MNKIFKRVFTAVLVIAISLSAADLLTSASPVYAAETAYIEVSDTRIPVDTEEILVTNSWNWNYNGYFDYEGCEVNCKTFAGDLSFLEELPKLKKVILCGKINSLEPLTKIDTLEELIIDGCTLGTDNENDDMEKSTKSKKSQDYSVIGKIKELKSLTIIADTDHRDFDNPIAPDSQVTIVKV